MRVALTKGTLRIPPTYFAVEHALALPQYEWHYFTLAAQVSIDLPFGVTEAAPSKMNFSSKEKLKYFSLGRMQRQIKAAKPDLIHQHMATWSLPAQKAASALEVPLVTTIHGTDLFTVDYEGKSPLPHWNRMNAQSALENSTKVVAVSNYLADRARERGVAESKLAVVYQGVDTDLFTPGTTEVSDRERRELVFVGALNDQKGIKDLVEASTQLVAKYPHDLTVVGDGPYAEHLRQQADAHPHIHPVGSMPRERMRTYLQRADALVLPTKTWRGRQEAAGLVLLEAQACGTPVIANAVGGTPEMVDPDLAWLTDESDPESLRQALVEVLQMPEDELDDLSARVRQWVVQERSARAGADHLAQLYEEVVS